MSKFVLTVVLLVSSASAFAQKLDMVAVSFFRSSGDVTKSNAPGCPTPDSCYSSSVTGLGVDFFLDSTSRDDTFSRGLWLGQDVGYARVSGDGMPFGATSLGYAWGFDFERLGYFIGLGYGVSYASLDSSGHALKSKTNDGFAFITGLRYSPFRLSNAVGLGMMLTLKASPYLPPVYAKDQLVNRRYYEPSLSSSFGIVFKFR